MEAGEQWPTTTHTRVGKAVLLAFPRRDGCRSPTPGVAVRGHRGGVLRHGAMFSRPVRQGDNTGVDAVCTYRKEPSATPLDRVGLYHKVSNKTRGIMQLGPYSLDTDSLYINGEPFSFLYFSCVAI